MKLFIIYLFAAVFITGSLLFSIPLAVADCFKYLVTIVGSIFDKAANHVVKIILGIAGLTSALTVMADDATTDIGMNLVELLLPFLINAASANPVVATALAIFAMSQPLIGIIANKTKNPHAGKIAIFGNKILQLMTFNSSKNQPDVLSVSDMIKTPPSRWEEKIRDKVTFNNIGR